ncbi:MAG: ClpXP protease specificity-enhancing factor SspB [Alphaproteobacteria bacterium]
MSEDLIRYDVLTSEALRGIVRAVLQRVQKRGLPGDHHFFVNFFTGAPGVILSKRLKEQYPEDMTIVLQHKFWDLFVYEDRFEVKLTFNNMPERLVVPYAAIKNFVDPSVPYGLSPNQFVPSADREGAMPQQMFEADEATALLPAASAEFEALSATGGGVTASVKDADSADDVDETAENTDKNETEQDETAEAKTAKVVELDLFRKK